MFHIIGISILGCSSFQEKDNVADQETPTCDTEEIPAQLRLLSRKEYDASILQLYYGEGDTCLDDEQCELSESCRFGVCRPRPCDIHTFVWPHEGDDVWIAGTFNDWEPQPMSQRDGVWVQTLSLTPGDWVYKFVVDGTWIHDAQGDTLVDDGYGGYNNTFLLQCSAQEEILSYPSRDIPLESSPQHFGFRNHHSSLVTSTHLLQYLIIAETLASNIVQNENFELVSWGEQAFRRPLTQSETMRYQSVDEDIAVIMMLTSPHFLYRDETRSLTDYRLATALSYFLWGAPPTKTLREQASSGALDTPGSLIDIVDDMLADPRAQQQLESFATQWLAIEGILTVDKGTHDIFDAVRSSIYKEAGQFVADIIVSDGSIEELVTATVDPTDDIYETINAGVLGLPAVLASNAHSDQTSPVMRGLFVRENLLCQHLGTPPANAGGVPDVDPNSSTRERFEQHSDDPSCAACHMYIDPIGFGFEQYNEIGEWRDMDGLHPIDASGFIDGVDKLGDGSGGSFETLSELGDHLAKSKQFSTCFSDHLLRFSSGRKEIHCAAQWSTAQSPQQIIKNIILSDTFLKRTQ